MNSKVYRWCAVPLCVNTSLKTPNKLFVNVSNNKTKRHKWLKLARRDPTSVKLTSTIYFCEDHFDLPNDMENFMEYHVMGSVSQIRMKPGCIPTKFQCQSDKRKRTSNTTKQPNILKKQRKIMIEENKDDLEERSITTNHMEEPGETSDESLGTMETFVAAVREHRCLWDFTRRDYRDAQVKDNAWHKVVIKCNDTSITNITAAKEKWKKLRDTHRNALKRSILGPVKWKYARSMQFLVPFMKHCVTVTETTDSEADEIKIANRDTDSTSENNTDPDDANQPTRQCVESTTDTSLLHQDGDALVSFFCCVLKSTRVMPSWMQTEVKKKIFEVIIEAEETLFSKRNSVTVEIKSEPLTEENCDYTRGG